MQKFFLKNILLLTVLYISCISGDNKFRSPPPFKEVLCKSITIRSVQEFNQLEKCTVVTGFVRIMDMNFTSSDLKKLKSSNIEEITEYLLVYRSHGLQSLEQLFPKLMIIRGVELLFDQCGLTIIENRDLRNIGLVSLLRVLRGSIRIERNPSLCFAQTVNWVWILGNSTKDYSFVLNHNKPASQCPLCYTYNDELKGIDGYRHQYCWSIGKKQKIPPSYSDTKYCDTLEDERVCLTPCDSGYCRHCANFVSDEGCVPYCLPHKHREAFRRQCISNCSAFGLVQLGMKCAESCPKNYQEVKKNGGIVCVLNCTGDFVIHSAKDLAGLSECFTLNGSLIIEVHDADEPIVPALQTAFLHLNEIIGYVKIINSPQIISLHFFKNLRMIKGYRLIENKYAVYVVGNNYLQELWPGNVAILYGCVYFHLNPRLCYEKIMNLQQYFRDCRKITVKDVSLHSNGERAVCGGDIITFNANVVDLNSDSALIEVDIVMDIELVQGYIYYHKEAPYKNVTKYDGRHGCGSDSWFTDVVLTKHRRHILKKLKPGTRYAYFVNSMTVLDYPYYAEHVSEIQYFETLPAKPGMVAKLYYHSLSTTHIEVHWWPPIITNGIIDKYILQYQETNDTIDYGEMHQNGLQVCVCPKIDTESNVPTPDVENYYNKEQISYQNSVLDFLLVKRPNSDENLRNLTEAEKAAAEADWQKILEKLENGTIAEQEEDKEKYVIPHDPPVCDSPNPNIQVQLEDKCTPLEIYKDAIEISSNRHSFVLSNLKPETTYRISLRACVKNLKNGCGPEKVLFAETVSKRLQSIIKSFTFHRM